METGLIEVLDYSGGITDEVAGAKPNQAERLDNLLISDDRRLFSRPGSVVLDTTHPQVIPGSVVKHFVNYNIDTDLFAVAGTALKRKTSSGWVELTGPTGNPAFPLGDDSNRVTSSDWREHVFMTDDSGALPIKFYRDENGTYQVRTAGLPRYEPTKAFTSVTNAMVDLANDIRTQMLAHLNSVPAHSPYSDTVAAGMITLGALSYGATLTQTVALINQLVSAYKHHYQDAVSNAGIHYLAMTGGGEGVVAQPNIALDLPATLDTYTEVAEVLNDLKRKFNWHIRSFQGHLATTTSITAASLDTEEGPRFTSISYTGAINYANQLKIQYNLHLADTSAHFSPFSGSVDTYNNITIADATDEDSLRELVAHLWQGYTLHQADAAYPVYNLTGTTNYATPTLITNVTTSTPPDGTIDDLEIGMLIYPNDSFPHNNWPIGTQVSAIDQISNQITMPTSHDFAGPSPDTTQYLFSKKQYHWSETDAEPTPSEATLNTGYTIASMVEDDSVLFSMLIDLSEKYNYHEASGYYHDLNNFHQVISPGAYGITETRTKGTYRYKYTFLWKYEYTTYSGLTFVDRGAAYEKTWETTLPIELISNSISNILTLTNTAGLNYATSSIVCEIYRTVANGTVSYYVGEVTNGTTTFTDNVTDEELVTREKLYTSGGVVENDPPPTAKYLHIVNDIGYYGNCKDGSEALPQRVRISVPGDIDACPADFYVDLPGAVQGVSSAKEIPMAWTKTGTYRLEGAFDEKGRGSVTAIPVSETIGMLGPSSAVKIDEGVAWAGNDGFYFSDGYRIQKLSNEFNTTYSKLVSTDARAKFLQGCYDKNGRRVWWAAASDDHDATEPDSCFIWDVDFGIKPDATFTTASGKNGSFKPTALAIWRGDLLRGDTRGYVFQHGEEHTSDPKVDTTIAASAWTKTAVIWDYISVAYDGGESSFRKMATKIVTRLKNRGNVSIQINAINDMGKNIKALEPIRFRGNVVWGDPTIVWGDTTITWDKRGEIEEKRWMNSGALRFTHKQIQMTNAHVIYINSDAYGMAVVDATAKTATLVNAATLDWPEDLIDFTIAFADDAYDTEFTITAQSADVLTFSDPDNACPATGTYRWVIRGKPKNEKFHLLAWAMPFQAMGRTQSDASGEPGGNA